MNTKTSTVFITALMIVLLSYMYAMYKVVIFNHSGRVIELITLEGEFAHKKAENIPDGLSLHYTLFSPFNKKVHIVLKQPDNIKSITFSLEGLFPLEQRNQLEILPDGSIRHGALGLKQQ
ncbi:MAG TPA: hypothetical protein PKM51_05775 [Chitinophagales bacterium]|nr:hypothetical protein [Chitinophagales bacterium]HNM32238.1 hypothetical protein [Chitinophagales bacterium]